MRTEDAGLDFSTHNGTISVPLLREFVPKVSFMFARTGMSWGYKDARFNYYRDIAENQLQIPFGGYHVIFPAESVKKQFDNMIAASGKKLAWYVVDDELIHGCTPAQKLVALGEFVNRILDAGLDAWVYSSPSWFNQYVLPKNVLTPSWLNVIKWWLAQYLYKQDGGIEYPNPPDLINGLHRDRVFIHQTTSKANGYSIGQESGSPALDLDRWLIGRVPGSTVTPEPTSVEGRLTSLEARVTVLENNE
jgi:hypothetical protein